jgi:hypothetical protein
MYHGENQSKCLHLVKRLTMGLWELGSHSIPPCVRPEFGKSHSQGFTLLHKLCIV